MENILDRVGLAFLRVFEDIAGGNFNDLLLTDIGIVALAVGAPLLMVSTFLTGPKS